MLTTILPEAARNGLKRIATIEPLRDDVHAEEYLAAIQLNISKFGILYKSFRNHHETLEWIQEEARKQLHF